LHPRTAKEIRLSPEAQTLFGVGERLTPPALIRAILKAPVDLLFFGGIGTYVRAADESDEAVGDRTNDAVRIAGADVRCKVIGEGANLGMTQRGRIEAALRGVRLNTDAIDNSAGVNTSDMEVNIKIALSIPLRDGRLTMDARNALLFSMTDEVAELVLRNNYLQTLALSLAERRGLEDLGFEQRLMQTLEAAGALDRPSNSSPMTQLAERRRRQQPFTGRSLRSCSPTPSFRSTKISLNRRCRTIAISAASSPATFPSLSARISPMRWNIIGCAAKSSPPSSPTR
jgi:glutamate dehydrogenase